jgi:hypothetical protein
MPTRADEVLTSQCAGMSDISIPWFSPEMGHREQQRVATVIASNYVNDGSIAGNSNKLSLNSLGVAIVWP